MTQPRLNHWRWLSRRAGISEGVEKAQVKVLHHRVLLRIKWQEWAPGSTLQMSAAMAYFISYSFHVFICSLGKKKKSNYCADNYYTETAWLVHPCRISAALEHYFSTSALGTLLIPRNKHKDPDMVPKDVHDIGLVYFPTPLDTCRPGLLGAGWCGIPPAPSSFSASPALVLTTVSGTGPCETGPPSGKSSDRTRTCVRRCRLASGPCQGRRKK